MSDPVRALTSTPMMVTIVAGPDKGVAFKLISAKVSLGREADNDISLNDPRCSRHHAVVEQLSGEWIIRDLGSQNGMIYNGQVVRQAKLKSGDLITIGDTQFKFQAAVSTPSVAQRQSVSSIPLGSVTENEGKSPMFYIIIGIIVIAGAALYMQDNETKQKKTGIRTEEQIQAEIEETQQRKEELSRTKRMEGQFSQQYLEAQAAYIQGFRDYREGNYSRALQSFTAALALYPNHELALMYKKLSERKLDELVQASLFEGKRYMEQNKYELAKAAYKNVMVLLNDPNNKTYLEAKERYEEIELLLSGRF